MNSTSTESKAPERPRRPRVPPLKSLVVARDPQVVLSDRFLERRAERGLRRSLKQASEASDTEFDTTLMHLTLPCISDRARDEFMRQAWDEAKEWLKSDTARKLKREHRKSINADLCKWHERQDAATAEEKHKAQALASQKVQEAKLEKEAWLRRRNDLRAQVSTWRGKRAQSAEVKKPARVVRVDQVRHRLLRAIASRNREELIAAVDDAERCSGLERYLVPRATSFLRVLNAEHDLVEAMQSESPSDEKFEALTIALQRGERTVGVSLALVRQANNMLTTEFGSATPQSVEKQPNEAASAVPAAVQEPETAAELDNFQVAVMTTTGEEHVITGLQRSQELVSFRNLVAAECGVHAGMVKLILRDRVFTRHDLASSLEVLGIRAGVKIMCLESKQIYVDVGMNIALVGAGATAVNGVYTSEKEDERLQQLGVCGQFYFRRQDRAYCIRWLRKPTGPVAGWYVEENPDCNGVYFLPSDDSSCLPLTQWQVYTGDGSKPGMSPVPTVQEEPT